MHAMWCAEGGATLHDAQTQREGGREEMRVHVELYREELLFRTETLFFSNADEVGEKGGERGERERSGFYSNSSIFIGGKDAGLDLIQ